MADVFISYSRHDRAIAKDLAEDLHARNFEIWWDSKLYAGVQFHNVIRNHLRLARAVIVIWSEHSVGSIWVVGEAQLAANEGKLINTLVPKFSEIPKNHLRFQAVLVTNRGGIVDALAHQGVLPASSIVQGLDRDLISRAQSVRRSVGEKRKAFICYALEDLRQVQSAICAYEAGNEVTVFLDVPPYPPNATLNVQTEMQLSVANMFILFWSRAASSSMAVSREINVLNSHLEARKSRDAVPLEIRVIIIDKNAPILPGPLSRF